MRIGAFGYRSVDGTKQFFAAVFVTAWCVIAAAPSWGETIKGSVRYVGAPVDKKKVSVTIDQYVCGKEKEPEDLVLSSNSGIRNAVVSLQNLPPGAKWDWNPAPAKMDQKQCSFVPRVAVVLLGGTVEFLNSDRVLHIVKRASKEHPPLNRAQPHARALPFVSKEPQRVPVHSRRHSWIA